MSTEMNNAAATPPAVDWSMLDAVQGRRFSAAMSDDVNRELLEHLLQWGADQEDLTFALWTPSISSGRLTALVHTPILPGVNDRVLHGNVAFNQEYLDRALAQ